MYVVRIQKLTCKLEFLFEFKLKQILIFTKLLGSTFTSYFINVKKSDKFLVFTFFYFYNIKVGKNVKT